MIVSSFAQQYGIRLLREDISASEYRKLLKGINGDTPLGYVVGIRSEKDMDKIKKMTNQEKKIRADWAEFRRKQGIEPKPTMTIQQLQSILSSLGGGG